MKNKTGVLVVNLGTPDAPTTSKVRPYLSQFLNDPRVIDLPWLGRKLLVNLIIVPFRASKSAAEYKKLWTEKGSPLLFHGRSVEKKLQDVLGDDYGVHLAMRYKNPGIPDVLKEMQKQGYSRIVVFPMFPQYASSTTGSVMEEVMRVISKWWVIPELVMISQYHDHPGYIKGYVDNARKFNLDEYDHVLFSFHGLPERQVDKVYTYTTGKLCQDHNCEEGVTADNEYCYKATCYETAAMISKDLGINKDNYTVCFQSRLGKGWIVPFADEMIIEKAKEGAKKLLVFSPAFVADCLETTVEIGEAYQELFEEHGGEKIQLVDSLNDSDNWVSTIADIIRSRTNYK